jgi:hypothetical protein
MKPRNRRNRRSRASKPPRFPKRVFVNEGEEFDFEAMLTRVPFDADQVELLASRASLKPVKRGLQLKPSRPQPFAQLGRTTNGDES